MPRHTNQLTKVIINMYTGSAPPEPAGPVKNPAAVALGKLGGAKGGRVLGGGYVAYQTQGHR
jgi:hypothetical protein